MIEKQCSATLVRSMSLGSLPKSYHLGLLQWRTSFQQSMVRPSLGAALRPTRRRVSTGDMRCLLRTFRRQCRTTIPQQLMREIEQP